MTLLQPGDARSDQGKKHVKHVEGRCKKLAGEGPDHPRITLKATAATGTQTSNHRDGPNPPVQQLHKLSSKEVQGRWVPQDHGCIT
jgi:hypothetical protein